MSSVTEPSCSPNDPTFYSQVPVGSQESSSSALEENNILATQPPNSTPPQEELPPENNMGEGGLEHPIQSTQNVKKTVFRGVHGTNTFVRELFDRLQEENSDFPSFPCEYEKLANFYQMLKKATPPEYDANKKHNVAKILKEENQKCFALLQDLGGSYIKGSFSSIGNYNVESKPLAFESDIGEATVTLPHIDIVIVDRETAKIWVDFNSIYEMKDDRSFIHRITNLKQLALTSNETVVRVPNPLSAAKDDGWIEFDVETLWFGSVLSSMIKLSESSMCNEAFPFGMIVGTVPTLCTPLKCFMMRKMIYFSYMSILKELDNLMKHNKDKIRKTIDNFKIDNVAVVGEMRLDPSKSLVTATSPYMIVVDIGFATTDVCLMKKTETGYIMQRFDDSSAGISAIINTIDKMDLEAEHKKWLNENLLTFLFSQTRSSVPSKLIEEIEKIFKEEIFVPLYEMLIECYQTDINNEHEILFCGNISSAIATNQCSVARLFSTGLLEYMGMELSTSPITLNETLNGTAADFNFHANPWKERGCYKRLKLVHGSTTEEDSAIKIWERYFNEIVNKQIPKFSIAPQTKPSHNLLESMGNDIKATTNATQIKFGSDTDIDRKIFYTTVASDRSQNTFYIPLSNQYLSLKAAESKCPFIDFELIRMEFRKTREIGKFPHLCTADNYKSLGLCGVCRVARIYLVLDDPITKDLKDISFFVYPTTLDGRSNGVDRIVATANITFDSTSTVRELYNDCFNHAIQHYVDNLKGFTNFDPYIAFSLDVRDKKLEEKIERVNYGQLFELLSSNEENKITWSGNTPENIFIPIYAPYDIEKDTTKPKKKTKKTKKTKRQEEKTLILGQPQKIPPITHVNEQNGDSYYVIIRDATKRDEKARQIVEPILANEGKDFESYFYSEIDTKDELLTIAISDYEYFKKLNSTMLKPAFINQRELEDEEETKEQPVKRGRPKKTNKLAKATCSSSEPKRRGRPPKKSTLKPTEDKNSKGSEVKPKGRPRGRPKKSVPKEPVDEEEDEEMEENKDDGMEDDKQSDEDSEYKKSDDEDDDEDEEETPRQKKKVSVVDEENDTVL